MYIWQSIFCNWPKHWLQERIVWVHIAPGCLWYLDRIIQGHG